MDQEKIKELVAGMTLEEKAGLCSGADFWHTKAIERLGIPAVMEGASNPEMMQAMIQYMPLRSLISFNRMEEEQLEGLLAMLNQEGEEE